jgi:Uma2 family endonuclease
MTTRIIPPSSPPVPPLGLPAEVSAPLVPSLDALHRMTLQDNPAVIRSVSWAYYEKLLAAVGENGGLRLAYDGKDLEIMSPSPVHENSKVYAGKFVDLVAEELDIDSINLASTTWNRPEIERGIGADQCFYFVRDKLTLATASLARNSNNINDYPAPDLAIEIDLSPSKVDRPGIYAAMRVTEVWRFDTSSVVIERLDDENTYTVAQSSVFLPVTSDEVARWVLQASTSDRSTWKRRLRAWIRAELLTRPRGSQP